MRVADLVWATTEMCRGIGHFRTLSPMGERERTEIVAPSSTTPVDARRYFVTMRRGGALVGAAAGEITNVSHVFQPSGRWSEANSL